VDFDVQQHARALALRSPGHVRVGPFVARFHPTWGSPFANYAIPDDGATPSAADVRALVRAFHTRDRLPRLEYLPRCAPQVEPALLAAGFTAEDRPPLMACARGALAVPPPVDGLTLTEPADDAACLRAAAVQHAGFGEPGTASADAGAGLRRTVASGGVVVLATLADGTDAGAGVCTTPVDGLTELGGLAVVEAARRRGVGAAVAAHLTSLALERGLRAVWLEPGGPHVQRLYARLGYRVIGERLNISLR
jgi:ribosomal protein S18 acetylase RimI-like enzyme